MNLINKEFLEIGSGNVIKIIDVYQNIAVTSERERIDVRRLTDTKYYIPNDGGLFESKSISMYENTTPRPSEKKFEIKMDDYVDPNKFLNNERTYSMFAEAIKSIPEDKIPKGETEIQMPSTTTIPATNESAIIIDNNYDEKEELLRKYGINNQNQDLESYNKKFEKFLTDQPEFEEQRPQSQVQIIEDPNSGRSYDSPTVTRNQIQEDPITLMFRNVKRSVDFKIQIQIDNKIPRIDFIEMMEDSYETSIIEFFAEEFTNQLLKNPELIKKTISDEIKKMVYGEVKSELKKQAPKKATKTTKKAEPKKVTQKSKNIPPPPTPPKDRIIKEGKEPIPPQS